jgi:hypothetical protein
MAKIIAYNNAGSLGVIIPVLDNESKITEFASANVEAGVEYIIIDNSELPKDQTFRDALEVSGGIKFNADKAKAIWKNKWREARKSKLASLDIDFMRSVESGDQAKQIEIAGKKQSLRDVTLIEILGTTPEEIKSVWPEVLNDSI